MLNLYITHYSLYFVNCRRTIIAQLLGFGKKKCHPFWSELGPYAPNKKGALRGELTLRTSVINHASKGELALRGTFFI